MAKCDVNTLLARAKCFQCLDAGTLSVLETQLICNWLQGLNPTPPTSNFLLQENGFAILQENGGHILVA